MKGTCKAVSPVPLPASLATLAVAVALLAGSAVQAEIIAVGDAVEVRPSDLPRPERGMSMKAVEAKFGEPQQRHPAVGKPAITRWDYAAFTVFFENQYVIDAVVNPAAPAPAAAAAPAGNPTP